MMINNHAYEGLPYEEQLRELEGAPDVLLSVRSAFTTLQLSEICEADPAE